MHTKLVGLFGRRSLISDADAQPYKHRATRPPAPPVHRSSLSPTSLAYALSSGFSSIELAPLTLPSAMSLACCVSRSPLPK